MALNSVFLRVGAVRGTAPEQKAENAQKPCNSNKLQGF